MEWRELGNRLSFIIQKEGVDYEETGKKNRVGRQVIQISPSYG
nr:MAG TPA: hypothetical protein [Caudoviricetes sp.]